MIGKCKANCKHKTQDELHGNGMRVLNHVPGGSKKPDAFRCTVCKTVHETHEAKKV